MKALYKSKTGRAFKWNILFSVSDNIINFSLGIILARILEPSDFGILAVVMVFGSFANSFVDGGFGSAIVQSKQLKKSDLSTIYNFNLLVAIIFSILLFSFSGLIGTYFENENIEKVSKLITLIFLFQALKVVPKNLLVRNMDFKSIAIIELTATMISGFSSVLLALNGFEFWALALRIIIKFFTNAFLYNLKSRINYKLELNINIIKKYWDYSINVLSTSLFVNFKTKLDVLIVGKLLNTENLGLYSKGKQYATLNQTFLYMVFNKPLFSTFSKISDSNFLEYYNKWFKIFSFVILSSFLSIFLISDEIILLLLGQKWKASIIYLKIFLFWGIFKSFLLFNYDIFNSKSKPNLNLKNSFFEFFTFIFFTVFFYVVTDASKMGIFLSVSAVLSTFFSYVFQNYQLINVLKESFVKNIFKNIKELLITSISLMITLLISSAFKIDNHLIFIAIKLFLFVAICSFQVFLFKPKVILILKK